MKLLRPTLLGHFLQDILSDRSFVLFNMNFACVMIVITIAAVAEGCGVGKQMIRKYFHFDLNDTTVQTQSVNIRKKFSRIRDYLHMLLVSLKLFSYT